MSSGTKVLLCSGVFVVCAGGPIVCAVSSDKSGEIVVLDAGDKPTVNAAPGVTRDFGCEAAAARLIKKGWKCGLNMTGFSEESLCYKIDSTKIRYFAGLDTCNEFLTRMGVLK